MEPKTSIKQHDFISGEPKDKWFTWDIETTNPCVEMVLPSVGRSSQAFERLMRSAERNGFTTPNFDYMHLYPEIQRTHNIVPEGWVTTENTTNPYQVMTERLVELRRDRREGQRVREIEDNDGFINKIILNSSY